MLEIFYSGGPVMYPLLACSVIVLTIVIERSFFWARISVDRDQRLLDEVMELSQQGEWLAVRDKVTYSRDYIIRILVAGILHAFNLLLGIFAPSVHSLRLHYVEFFSKFLDLGGRRFEPWQKPHP